MSQPYNPLDMGNLGESIVAALLTNEPSPMNALAAGRFTGAGIYAIYYTGPFPAYELLARANRDSSWAQPIYVGKAVPSGGRRGVLVATQTVALWDRLREHAASLSAAANLELADFACRWLVIEPIWIPLGESLMITRYAPVWNALIDGFGNHDPGRGRHQGARTRWDVLHPGRAWSENLQPRTELVDIIGTDAAEYLRARLAP